MTCENQSIGAIALGNKAILRGEQGSNFQTQVGQGISKLSALMPNPSASSKFVFSVLKFLGIQLKTFQVYSNEPMFMGNFFGNNAFWKFFRGNAFVEFFRGKSFGESTLPVYSSLHVYQKPKSMNRFAVPTTTFAIPHMCRVYQGCLPCGGGGVSAMGFFQVS